MNAPPFPTNPAVGEFFGNWVWNGARWVCSPAAGVRVVIQTFATSGPYMPSQGLVTAVVEAVGGGGDGGAVAGAGTTIGGGGGGGSGGYSKIALAAALVAGGVQVTIGGGGVVNPPSSNPNDYAAYGAATTFGALCVANGGGGGGGNAASGNIWGWPGLGAPAGVGDLAVPGNPGDIGTSQGGAGPGVNVVGGCGGAIMGGAGMPTLTGAPALVAGNDGTGPGAGGGGAAMNDGAGAIGGGKGAAGVCIVTEYCWADTAPDGDCVNPVNVNARVAVTHVPWQGPGPCPPGWGGQLDYDGEG